MDYFVYKMYFSTPVHIGNGTLASSENTIMADTLFSALCCETGNQKDIDKMVYMAKNKEFILSDAMPFIGDELYIPKPMLVIKTENEGNSILKKAFKKLINSYLEENMSLTIMVNYLKNIKWNSHTSIKVLKEKLNSFFKMLDDACYVLTPSDAEALLEQPILKKLFEKYFSDKKEIEEKVLDRFTDNNTQLEILCDKYMEQNKILKLVIEEENENINSIYYQEIRKSKLLTAEQEIELGKRIVEGDE